MSDSISNTGIEQPSTVYKGEDRFCISAHSPAQQRWYLLVLFLVLAQLASVYPVLAGSSYKGCGELHATIEMVGAIIGLITGFALVVRFYVLGNRFYLFTGLAFFVNGAEDFVHGFLAFDKVYGFVGMPAASIEQFIPGTYVAGRILMGFLLLAAVFAAKLFTESKNSERETFWASFIVIVITICATAIAFKLPLPKFIYPAYFISRPVDFISAVLLFVVFVLFLRNYIIERDILSWWLLLSVGVSTVGQVMMSFSRQLFDSFFDIAHVYKVLGYAIPLLGFSLYQIAVIAERKRAENTLENLNRQLETTIEKLTLSNRELQDFASAVAHDLKTPLRGVSMLSDWLSRDYGDKLGKRGKERIELLIRRIMRMDNLIDGILGYHNIGQCCEKEKDIDLNALLSEVISEIKLPENIEIILEDKLPTIVCKKTHIKRIFVNLLNNPVKYMDKPKGRIRVNCIEEGGFWKFSVADNGPGIEEKYFGKIFKIFQTLAPRDSVENIGISLPVVKKIVQFYGGKIWVESEVGTGSTFFFTLPKQKTIVANG